MVAAGNAQLSRTLAGVKESVAVSCSVATSSAYMCCIKQFCEFCINNGRNWALATNADVILYLQVLKDKGLSFLTLLQQASAISRFYLLADKPDPTAHKLVSAIVSTVKRLLQEVRRAVPATIAHMKMLAAHATESNGLPGQRAFIMSLILLCSCCRLDDIIWLKRKEVHFVKGGVRMTIPKSKTDQYRKGHVKYMAAAKDPSLCPVKVLTVWMEKRVGKRGEDAVFPHSHKASKPTSKSTFRSALDQKRIQGCLA